MFSVMAESIAHKEEAAFYGSLPLFSLFTIFSLDEKICFSGKAFVKKTIKDKTGTSIMWSKITSHLGEFISSKTGKK